MSEFVDANMLCWVGAVTSTDGLEASIFCKASGFPFVGILAPITYRGALQVVLVGTLQGQFSQDDLMVTMVKMTEAFEPVVAATIAERAEREQELELRRQQDEEFESALATDRQRQQEAQAAEAESQLDAQLQAALEASRIEEEERKKQLQQVVLPPEPVAGPRVAKVQFGLPTGERATRRFGYDDRIELLKSFVLSKGVVEDFQLVRSFPTKQLEDMQETVEHAGLVPSAQVLVTLIDASDEEDD